MIVKCVNPACETEFKYLNSGRVVRMVQHVSPAPQVEHYWLCGVCSATNDITILPDGTVTASLRSPDLPWKRPGKDITSQQALQILTQHASEHLFELSPDAILLTDAEGIIYSTNPGSTEMFGYTAAELHGKSVEDLIPKRFRTMHAIHRENYAAHPRTRSMDSGLILVGLHKDGTEIPVDVVLKPIVTSTGSLVICIVRDVTEQRAAQEIARRYDQQMRSVAGIISDYAIYLLDPEGNVKSWNPGGEQIKGYTEEEILGSNFSRFFTQEDVDIGRPAQLLRDAAIHGSARAEGWRVRKDGARFWADVVLTSIQDDNGAMTGYAKVARDMTARKQVKERMMRQIEDELRATSIALQASELRYHKVYETSPEAVTISRVSDGVIVDVNRAFLDVTGYDRREITGRTTSDLGLWVRASDRVRFAQMLSLATGIHELEFQFRRKNQDVFWARLSASLIEVDGIPCILSFARDISEAKEAEEKIAGLAFRDPLTGVANRRLLMDRLTHAIAATVRRNSKLGLMFIDLDNFKILNDTFGHFVGDLLLQEFARRLTACTRETDSVGRFGGDEFVVMLENLSDDWENAATQARVVAEKILAAVALPCLLDGNNCGIACSIGITLIGDNKIEANEVLQQADFAMYQAKATGPNAISFFSSGS
ncbi:MAG TPA: PAS domain S-box protein [Acidobacteriaceae bacterium]